MRNYQHRGCSGPAHLAAAVASAFRSLQERPSVHILIIILLAAAAGQASEFPERECCDPVYPLPAPPASTTPYPSVPTATGRVVLDPKSAVAILNCLLARQLCFEDASCSAILEIIPRVCGPEQVACSTVTVTKCQAALKTLQAFPFFRPTCLCREPHVDPECNSFREFLFDHPCNFVNKKEKDPYPVDALPTCNHALSVCQLERKCIKLFEDFKSSCKVRDGRCRMDERESCHAAWTKLRLSPMFGCICPNNHMKKRCDRIFSMVNHNPCVDVLPASLDLSGTDSALYPYDPEQDKFREFWFPPTSLYPYFLLPPTTRPRLTHISSSHPQHPFNVPPYETTNNHLTVDDPILIPIDSIGGTSNVKLTSSRSGSISVKVIPSENTSFDGIESQLENPLFGIRGASQKDINTLRQELQGFKDNINASVFDEDGEIRSGSSSQSSQVLSKGPTSAEGDVEVRTFNFQSTCHLALDKCNNNYNCRLALQPVLQYCELSRCTRDACMAALQNFYRTTDLKWSLEVAFCLCRKTDNKQDECLVAQEKLHPFCAQRVEGTSMPTCHSLADTCRDEHSCRSSLEYYEQSCAVDSVTKKCAGPPAECRKAMLGILGTSLRSNCACKGTDFSQLYDCLGWQRLLWVNPCVVESQKDFHAKRMADTTPQPTSPARNISTWTPAPPPPPPSTTSTSTTPVIWTQTVFAGPRAIPTMAPIFTTEATIHTIPIVPVVRTTTTPEVTEEPSTSTTTPTTTIPTTTTEPPRYCVVQRPHHSDQFILEGTGKRLYRENEPECSELCQCNEGEQLVCNTLCVDRAPCKTDFAFYNHAAPAYQAYRGRCMCYSGKFICMRPSPDMYNLPPGVFLFLGYSETDESLLRPHSNLTIHDTVDALQQLLRFEPSKKGECALFLYNVTKENVIIVAKLAHENFTYSRDLVKRTSNDQLQHEKEECSGPLQDLSDKINNQHAELHSHQLLSILKMAEVEVKVPASSSGSRLIWGPPLCLLALIIPVLFAQIWGPSPS